MPVARNTPSGFELKSAALTLVSVVLKTPDLTELALALDARFADAPQLFDREPVAIDLSGVRGEPAPIDFVALVDLLRARNLVAVAVKGGSEPQMQDALQAGLVQAQETAARAVAAAAVPAPAPAPAPAPQRQPALIVDKPLRSGQRIYARGGDLVVLAVVSHGAEVIADGNIHVYAPLRGRAMAGARGDAAARIFCTCMEPQLLSIAGIYRTTETELSSEILGKAAQVRLDGEKLVVEPLTY